MIHCNHCGHENADNTQYCGQCGRPLPASPPAPAPAAMRQQTPPPSGSRPPDNHLAKAIIATIICCLPLGIVAIVYASSVNGKFIAGDVAGAQEASRNADLWGNWSIGVGLAGGLIYAVIMLIGIAAEAAV